MTTKQKKTWMGTFVFISGLSMKDGWTTSRNSSIQKSRHSKNVANHRHHVKAKLAELPASLFNWRKEIVVLPTFKLQSPTETWGLCLRNIYPMPKATVTNRRSMADSQPAGFSADGTKLDQTEQTYKTTCCNNSQWKM